MTQPKIFGDVNINEIRMKIDTFVEGVENHIRGECVLVVGGTRSGKSTVMNILAEKNTTVQKQRGRKRIVVVDEDYAGVLTAPGFEKISIGHGHDSRTEFPNYIMVDNVQYWDCPGTNDNRGPDVDIQNTFYVHKILSVATGYGKGGVKFIIVQNYNGLDDDGGVSFYNHIELMCKIFEAKDGSDFQKLLDATVFVFNKVPDDVKQGEKFMDNVLAQIESNMKDEEIEKFPIAKIAGIKFVKEMRNRCKDIKYVVLPQAQRSTQCVTDAIFNPKDGLKKKVASLKPILNCEPRIAVGSDSANTVFLLLQHYQTKIEAELEKLLTELHKELEASGIKSALNLMRVLPPLILKRSKLDHGGATEVFQNLITELLPLQICNKSKEILENLKDIVDQIKFIDKIIRNVRAGADFTLLIDVIVQACQGYLTTAARAALEEYTQNKHAYITEQNTKNTLLKIIASPVWLGLKAANEFCGLATRVEKMCKNVEENDTVLYKSFIRTKEVFMKFQGIVYGFLSKPNEVESNKVQDDIKELNKQFEDILKMDFK